MLTSLLLLSLQAVPETPASDRPFALMLGDAAPAIQAAEWVQGAPVARFEPGMTYVVEFWATWCPPCKKAIPHLNELSKQYAGKVQVVGVSVWERLDAKPYAVPSFVKAMGDQMTYTVAADRVKPADEGPMATKWMSAAGQDGIPTTFIVNGQGKVAWIGSPFAVDKPLAAIVAGTWDLDAEARKYALDMRLKGASAKLVQEVTKAKKEKDFATALRLIDEAIAADPVLEESYGIERYFLLLESQRVAEAGAYGQRLVSQVIATSPMKLNKLAWTIVDPQGKWKAGDYALAVRAAEIAVKLQDEQDASTLDTLGLALFKAGQIERAIQVQEKAVRLAKGAGGELETELQTRLEEFRNARKNL